jgi:hypothetical protein
MVVKVMMNWWSYSAISMALLEVHCRVFAPTPWRLLRKLSPLISRWPWAESPVAPPKNVFTEFLLRTQSLGHLNG